MRSSFLKFCIAFFLLAHGLGYSDGVKPTGLNHSEYGTTFDGQSHLGLFTCSGNTSASTTADFDSVSVNQ